MSNRNDPHSAANPKRSNDVSKAKHEYWKQIICLAEESGVDKETWCRKNGIPIKTFNHYQGVFKRHGAGGVASEIKESVTPTDLSVERQDSDSASGTQESQAPQEERQRTDGGILDEEMLTAHGYFQIPVLWPENGSNILSETNEDIVETKVSQIVASHGSEDLPIIIEAIDDTPDPVYESSQDLDDNTALMEALEVPAAIQTKDAPERLPGLILQKGDLSAVFYGEIRGVDKEVITSIIKAMKAGA